MKPTSEILKRMYQNSGEHPNGIYTRLYRYLLREDIYMTAYKNLYANNGAGTKGVDNDTADGFSVEYVQQIIAELKSQNYSPKAVRRTYRKKSNGKMRPLGIPSFKDKLVQDAVRQILESIYEPVFSEFSHGFRPNRSCHTALQQASKYFRGTKWFIEGDIKGCLPGAVSLSIDANGENENFFADDSVYYVINNNSGYEGDLEVALLPLDFTCDILGERIDANGVLTERNTDEVSQFALMFEFSGDKHKIRHVLYCCTASRPATEGQTNEDSKEVKTETLSLTASALVNGLVKSKTSEATVQTAYDNWYKSVYMPFLPTSKATTTTKE